MPRFDKGQADDFYRRFFDKAGEVLKEEGVIILVSEEMGIIKKELSGLKVLGNGELEKKITIKANRFSTKAVSKIENAGGTAEVI